MTAGLTHAAALLVLAMISGPASADDAMPVIDGQPLNPLQSAKPSDFSSFVKRPLFRPTRRPVEHVIPMEAQSDEAPAASPELTLLGVTSTPDGAVARIAIAERTSRSLRKGEEIEGWRVQNLDGSSVTLTRNGKTIELKIFGRDDPGESGNDPMANPDGGIIFGPADTVEPIDHKEPVRVIKMK